MVFRRDGRVFLLLALLAACAGGVREGANLEQPQSVTPIIAAAERARERGDFDAAIAGYQQAIARTPWNSLLEGHLAASYVERATHSRDEGGIEGVRAAEQDLRRALELLPNDAAIQRSLATVLVDLANRQLDPARARALREEAGSLAPEVVEATPVVQPRLERRLDLAYELLERGQTEAGIERLVRIHAEHPDHAPATRLLAQARVRLGNKLAERGDYLAAGEELDLAVTLYAELGNCRRELCELAELRLAHQNRIAAWANAARPEQARVARKEAETLGLRFP